MIATHLGLPNNCSNCGKLVETPVWYASSVDAARAGQGLDERCAKTVMGDQPLPVEGETVMPLASVEPPAPVTPPAPPDAKAQEKARRETAKAAKSGKAPPPDEDDED